MGMATAPETGTVLRVVERPTMPRYSRTSPALAWTTLIVLAYGSHPVFAGEWRIRPTLGLTERYSDNINGAPEGLEQDDFITSLNAGMSLIGTGARVRINANYSAQQSFAVNNSEINNLTHFLSGNARTEIIENFFFVDANATMTPTVVSNTGRITNQNFLDVGGNRADVINWTVTPRVQHAFGSYATATAQTTFGNTQANRQDFGTNNFAGRGLFNQGGTGNFAGFGAGNRLAGSGGTNSYSASLVSGRRFQRFNWGVNYLERQFDADAGGQESTLRTTSVDMGYRINRRFRVFGNIGDESNDFSGNQNIENGMTWFAGAEFNPTPRTRLTGSYGDRSFGSTKNFQFSHRMRRLRINGSYTEELSTTAERLQRQQQALFQNLDVFGNPVNDLLNPLDLANIRFPTDNLSLTDDVFISRNFNSSIGYRYRLNDFNLTVFRAEQESSRTQDTEEALGINFSWNRPFTRRLSGNFNFNWQDRSASGLNESTQAMFITPGITYRLGEQLSSRLSYSYSENSSDFGTNDFKENSIVGSLTYAF